MFDLTPIQLAGLIDMQLGKQNVPFQDNVDVSERFSISTILLITKSSFLWAKHCHLENREIIHVL